MISLDNGHHIKRRLFASQMNLFEVQRIDNNDNNFMNLDMADLQDHHNWNLTFWFEEVPIHDNSCSSTCCSYHLLITYDICIQNSSLGSENAEKLSVTSSEIILVNNIK